MLLDMGDVLSRDGRSVAAAATSGVAGCARNVGTTVSLVVICITHIAHSMRCNLLNTQLLLTSTSVRMMSVCTLRAGGGQVAGCALPASSQLFNLHLHCTVLHTSSIG